jgi:hypothetical protein
MLAIMETDPFRRPDARDYAEIFADGLVITLGERGLAAWSVGAVARWMKISPAAVLQRYSRARFLEVALIAFSRRWLAWTNTPDFRDEDSDLVVAALPRTVAERHGVRVWYLRGELARGELLAGRPELERKFAAVEERAHGMLARRLAVALDRVPTDREALETAALVAGLRHLSLAATPVVDADQSRAMLVEHVSRLRSRAAPPEAGGPAPAGR